MNITRVIAFAVIAASSSLGIAQAKSLRDADLPAEFPPSSFTGRQYVDSEGCVFVRAGIDGNVTWVPRVTRARQTMCNQQPSLATARAPAPAPAPAAIPESQTQPKTVTAAPQSTPKRIVRAAPVPVPAARVMPAPQPVAKVAAAPQPVAKTTPRAVPRTVAAAPGCAGASAISSRYTTTTSGYVVRCGPQTADHVTRVIRRVPGTQAARSAPRAIPAPVYVAPAYAAAPRPTAVPAYAPRTAPTVAQAGGTRQVVRVVQVDPYTTRVAPRHVVRQQVRAAQDVIIPDGYKRVWMDGRLNPQRAHQTFAGKAQMNMMWTQTVPRRLILTDTGRDMSGHYPGLIYPYTSYEQQRAAMSAPKPRATVSTRSRQPEAEIQAPKTRATVSSNGQNYVQAGVFTSRAQAQQAAQRLVGVGLPARLGSMTRGGTRYSLLLSGPFASAQAAQGALAQVRGAGFGNARLR